MIRASRFEERMALLTADRDNRIRTVMHEQWDVLCSTAKLKKGILRVSASSAFCFIQSELAVRKFGSAIQNEPNRY